MVTNPKTQKSPHPKKNAMKMKRLAMEQVCGVGFRDFPLKKNRLKIKTLISLQQAERVNGCFVFLPMPH